MDNACGNDLQDDIEYLRRHQAGKYDKEVFERLVTALDRALRDRDALIGHLESALNDLAALGDDDEARFERLLKFIKR